MAEVINIILCVVSIGFSLWSVVVGISYVKINKKSSTKKTNSAKNQKTVEDNLDIFGICNQGETMDNHSVYCIPYDNIGF